MVTFLKSMAASELRIDKREVLKSLRLLIQYGDVDVYSIIKYSEANNTNVTSVTSVDGLLHTANLLFTRASKAGHLFETVQMFVQHGCDLEHRNDYDAIHILCQCSS